MKQEQQKSVSKSATLNASSLAFYSTVEVIAGNVATLAILRKMLPHKQWLGWCMVTVSTGTGEFMYNRQLQSCIMPMPHMYEVCMN